MVKRSFGHTVLVLSVGFVGLPASAISWDGNGDGSTWNDPVNWLGNVMPGSGDTASIGDLAAIENSFLNININDSLAGLTITDGMRLDTNGFTLTILGDTLLSGQNVVDSGGFNIIYSSGLAVDRGAGADDFDTDDLTLTDEASLRLLNGGIVEIDNVLTVGNMSRVSGEGVISLIQGSGTVFVNNGYLDPSTEGMEINVSGTGLIDLDGNLGTGSIQASASKIDGSAFDNLTINGTGLSDAFDGDMSLTANGFINLNLSNGWTLGAGGTITMHGNSSHPGPADIRGGDVTILGEVSVGPGDAYGRFQASVDAQTGSTFNVSTDDLLEFNGSTNAFEGSTFNLSDGADVDFKNATTVQSATFVFDNPADGIAEFKGNTTYSFNTTITSNGVVQQTGDATVIGSMVVNGGKFDLDGFNGSATINLGNIANNGSMTLNVDAIDTANNIFNGTINTDKAGLTGSLTVNLPGNDAWTMAGFLNLVGTNNLFNPTRISGSKMIVTGTINLVDGKPANIAADTDLADSAVINTGGATSRLSVSGQTHVADGATFNGTGQMRNAGTLTLADGVDTNSVELVNNGTLIIGDSPGTAIVPDFEQTSNGVWQVEIGGMNPGTQHDRLNVGGTATLGGQIDLSLILAYDPALLAEVTVLSSFTRNDTFDTVGGVLYTLGKALAVTYTPTDVLVTATIPGDIDLDGDVDNGDLAKAISGFTGPGGSEQTWVNGDLNGDGVVDNGDLALAISNFTGPGPAPVPEPVSLALLTVGGLLLTRRRRA